MLESIYQGKLIKKLERMFPGIIILKNDSDLRQGIPDLILLYNDRWAALEVKAYKDAPTQPNQFWYITKMDEMSYAEFIYPENEVEVFSDLHETFRTRR
jgi:hypothetical protein